jgi:hypothetical protein
MNDDGCPGICDEDDDGDGYVDEDRNNNEPGDPGYDEDCYVDDDENGYYDDNIGWDFANDDNVPGWYDSASADHGTRVTGFAAAVTNNNLGIARVGWEAKHMQVQDHNTETFESTLKVSEAVQYAVDMGAHVINANFCGDEDIPDPLIEYAVGYAYDHGVPYICPVGNVGGWTSPGYPSWDIRTIGVAGTNEDDEHGANSITGQSIDVSAPYYGVTTDAHDTSAYMDLHVGGTCMATPHVSGVASLLKEIYMNDSTFTVDSLYKALIIGAASWKDSAYSEETGFGRIDAEKAIKYSDQSYIAARLLTPRNEHPYHIGGPYPGYRDTVFVTGTATANNFDYYQLIHIAPDNDTTTYAGYSEKVKDSFGQFVPTVSDTGTHTLILKVCRNFGRELEREGGGVPFRRCGFHEVSFDVVYVGSVFADITPNHSVALPDSGGFFNYSIKLSNPDSVSQSGTFQIDYTYEDSTYEYLGPYDCSLTSGASLGPIILLDQFTENDSSGTYTWNLRVFDDEEEQISVDSFDIELSD